MGLQTNGPRPSWPSVPLRTATVPVALNSNCGPFGRLRISALVLLLLALCCGFAQEARIALEAGASDPEGDKLTCQWKQVGGPKARIDQPTKLKTFFVPSEPGEYVFAISVSDGEYTVSDKVTVVVKPPNKPPIANAAGPAKLVSGESVQLDGTASTDPDGQIKAYRWLQTAGPRVTLPADQLNSSRLEFKAQEPGDYAFELTVFDGKAWSKPASVAFVVAKPNQRPRLSLNVTKHEVEWPGESSTGSQKDPVKVNPTVGPKPEGPIVANPGQGGEIKLGEDIVLDASASKDPQGGELTYRWEQRLTDAPILSAIRHDPTSAKGSRRGPDHCPVWRCRPTVPGVYEFELVVASLKAPKRKATASVTYNVKGKKPPKPIANKPPTVQVPDALKGKIGEEIRIEAVVSDAENDPIDVTWTVLVPADLRIPKEALAQRTLVFTPKKKGTHVFGVVAQDAQGRSEPKQVKVEVSGRAPILNVKPPVEVNPDMSGDKNHLPLAAMQPLARPIEVGQEGLLDGTLSLDEDGDALTYRWRVVEGAECVELVGADQPHLTVRGLKPGAVKIELVVNDGKADSKPAFLPTEIMGKEPVKPPAKPPIAKCELISKPPFLVGTPLRFSGAKSSDPAQKKLTYHWKALGANADKLEIPADTGAALSVNPAAAGDYTIELRVSNGEADSEPVSVTFSVEEPVRRPVAVIAPVVPCEAGQKILLDGSPSKSARGKSLRYRWECVSHPKDGKISFGWGGYKKQKPTVKLPKDGEYVFELKVTEDREESEPVRVTVRTRPPNQGPRASAIAVAGFQEEDLKTDVDLLKLPYVLHGDLITVEEGWPVLLDGSGSRDPDNGPEPLSCNWKQIEGPTVKAQEDGMRLRFKAPAAGKVVFEMVVGDGKDYSAPAKVTLNVLKARTLPVAVPRAYVSPPGATPPASPPEKVIEIMKFKRKAKMTPADPVLILDGQLSTYTPRSGEDKGLRYIWKQIGGEDLQLRAEKLNKPRVGLLVYHPGRYRFMLLVNDGRHRSLPAVLDIVVKDPSLKGSEGLLIKDGEKKAAKPEDKPRSAIDTNPEDEGELLPPPKDATLPARPAVATKQPIRPDTVAMRPAEETKPKILRTSAGGGTVASPNPPVVTRPKPMIREKKRLTLDPIPGEITKRARMLMEKDYREGDPVFQKHKRRAEDLALEPGSKAENELIMMFREKDEDLRAAAALALVERGMGSVPGLIRQLEQQNGSGAPEAHWALCQISHKTLPPDAASWKKWWSTLLSE